MLPAKYVEIVKTESRGEYYIIYVLRRCFSTLKKNVRAVCVREYTCILSARCVIYLFTIRERHDEIVYNIRRTLLIIITSH